ncbi:unnamed protein product [Phaeothamnion confervicola]
MPAATSCPIPRPQATGSSRPSRPRPTSSSRPTSAPLPLPVRRPRLPPPPRQKPRMPAFRAAVATVPAACLAERRWQPTWRESRSPARVFPAALCAACGTFRTSTGTGGWTNGSSPSRCTCAANTRNRESCRGTCRRTLSRLASAVPRPLLTRSYETDRPNDGPNRRTVRHLVCHTDDQPVRPDGRSAVGAAGRPPAPGKALGRTVAAEALAPVAVAVTSQAGFGWWRRDEFVVCLGRAVLLTHVLLCRSCR